MNSKATLCGALVGAAFGYLFFTDDGREMRRRLEVSLDALERELGNARKTVDRASAVAGEGWKLLTDVVSDSARQPLRYPSASARQTSPF